MQAHMSHADFMAFAKSKGLALERITPTRVYLELGALIGMPTAPSTPAMDQPVDVWLTGRGERMIGVIKVIRSLTGLGLSDSKNLVDSCPKKVLGNIPYLRAAEIKKELEEAGASVEIR